MHVQILFHHPHRTSQPPELQRAGNQDRIPYSLKAAAASPSMDTVLKQKYQMGKLIGQGMFAKVYKATNLATGEAVAVKVIDKERVLRVGMTAHTKREIAILHRVRHRNVVRLHEVMASKTKIYFVMEYVAGGELFGKVNNKGKRMEEPLARTFFKQLVGAVSYCHSKGVYHRDLKPENLLIDEEGVLKVSDFGLGAVVESRRKDGLLHTTCGTPAYVAPEVIGKKGYDGAKADVWSSGVVLFVLLTGTLPFHASNLMEMYRKIGKGEFRCPEYVSGEAKSLLSRLLDPNPSTRISMAEVMESAWFKSDVVDTTAQPAGEKSAGVSDRSKNVTLEEVSAELLKVDGEVVDSLVKRACYNVFDIISLSPGFDLSGLFVDDRRVLKTEAMGISVGCH